MSVNPIQTQSSTHCSVCMQKVFFKPIGAALKILKALGKLIFDVITKPLHYLGTKTVTPIEILCRTTIYVVNVLKGKPQPSLYDTIFKIGYTRTFKPLPKEMTDEVIFLNRIFLAGHKAIEGKFDQSDWLPEGYTIRKCYIENGIKAISIEGPDEHYIVFGAKGAEGVKEKNCLNLIQTAGNIGGLRPEIFETAERLGQIIEEEMQSTTKPVKYVGHCFGGALAQYVALKRGRKAYCSNSLQIGAGAQWAIGRAKLSRATELVTHVSVAGDFLSRPNILIRIIDYICIFLGIRTPGNFGTKYSIPCPKEIKGIRDKHELLISAAIKYQHPELETFTRKRIKEGKKWLKEQDRIRVQAIACAAIVSLQQPATAHPSSTAA